mmetsp:Transcript_1315/g.3877  ORF Transcript_1315/g.3877 Transcript_1315/m.3877 type:complete len:235 (+) Transcript_1315:936-1640(+)
MPFPSTFASSSTGTAAHFGPLAAAGSALTLAGEGEFSAASSASGTGESSAGHSVASSASSSTAVGDPGDGESFWGMPSSKGRRTSTPFSSPAGEIDPWSLFGSPDTVGSESSGAFGVAGSAPESGDGEGGAPSRFPTRQIVTKPWSPPVANIEESTGENRTTPWQGSLSLEKSVCQVHSSRSARSLALYSIRSVPPDTLVAMRVPSKETSTLVASRSPVSSTASCLMTGIPAPS